MTEQINEYNLNKRTGISMLILLISRTATVRLDTGALKNRLFPWSVLTEGHQSKNAGSFMTEGRLCKQRGEANQMGSGLILDKELY